MGISLTKLSVVSDAQLPAVVDFDPGLNVVGGASDTGKSFILECIDYAMGARSINSIPESVPYANLILALKSKDQEYALSRSLAGGDAGLYSGSVVDIETRIKILAAQHDASTTNSISSFLLSLIDADKKSIIKSASLEKQSLSFRNLMPFNVIRESSIISPESIIQGRDTNFRTIRLATFRFLITGQDYSSVIAAPNKKIAKAQNLARIETLSNLVQEYENTLDTPKMPKASFDEAQYEKLSEQISGMSKQVSITHEEITSLEKERKRAIRQIHQASDKLSYIEEISARFASLAAQYEIDRNRLNTVIEASDTFSAISEAQCPTCGSELDSNTESVRFQGHEYTDACRAELLRLGRLEQDLVSARQDVAQQRADAEATCQALQGQIDEITDKLQQVLMPRLEESIGKHTEATTLFCELTSIRTQKSYVDFLNKKKTELQLNAKVKSSPKTGGVDIDDIILYNIAGTISKLLDAWKFPGGTDVHFDKKDWDLVVQGKPRKTYGKGYRAFIHAAFTIGLMQYCLTRKLPHPGFVVLDSPLVTLEEPIADTSGETIDSDMVQSFYRNLSSPLLDPAHGQIIILENELPPQEDGMRIRFHHFTKQPKIGRYGLFPVPT